MTDERPKKPLITANHVTLARLIPMPLIAWWIYAGHLRTALIVGTIVACTDFIDGYMARRQGPTVLGGLLDPLADKVFIALVYLPFADLNVIPAWACALMFVREFLVTSLRSAYELRGLSMKTSYLAKVKTWTQMQGIGVLLLFPMIGDRPIMTWLLVAGVVIPLIALALFWGIKRKPWKGAWVMSGSFAALLAVHLQDRPDWTFWFIMLLVVTLTWVSGLDYLVGAWKNLRGRGDFAKADAVRVVGAVVLPVMVFVVAEYGATHVWPLLAILALELAVGGLDNLLSHHQKAIGALGWGARVGGVVALLGASLLVPDYATFICVSAAALSTTGVVWEFWRGRDYYLDARLRDKSPDRARAALLRTQSSG
jgi:CDP-diacylglycerol--glycerol-3-phosphate 3-phosphatidyltransferase